MTPVSDATNIKASLAAQLPASIRALVRTGGRALCAVHRRAFLAALRRRCGGQTLLPLEDVLAWRRKQDRRANALAIPGLWTVSDGRALRNPFLADALANDRLGIWALDAETINFLEERIASSRPSHILEFGAGVSTLCLARFMLEQGHDSGPVVFSVEQNEWQAAQSRARLTALGLERLVRIIHAPLASQDIDGRQTDCYQLLPQALNEFLGGASPNMILIDGPAGDGNARFGTLPLIQRHVAPGAVFFLDDALRDDELAVAMGWTQRPGIAVNGLYALGKGLLTGTVQANHSSLL